MTTLRPRHLDEATLRRAATGPVPEAARLHLARCTRCQGELDLVRSLRSSIDRTASTCPEPATLVAFADGELPKAEAVRLLAHADLCPSCAGDIEGLSRVGELKKPPGQAPEQPPITDRLASALASLIPFEMPLALSFATRGSGAPRRPKSEMALAQYRAGRLAAAAKGLEAALKGGEEGADVHFHLGACLMKGGNVDKAAEHFIRAVELAPKVGEYRYYLAQAHLHGGRGQEAATELVRAGKLPGPFRDAAKDAERELRRLLEPRRGG